MAAGFAVAALLVAIVLRPGVARPLAAVALAGLAAHLALTLGASARAFGSFAPAAALTVETAVAGAAMQITGGLSSPLIVLPVGNVLLARHFAGTAAARFQALAGSLALLVLALLAPGVDPWGASRVLWPLAAALLLEIGQGAGAEARHHATLEPGPTQRTPAPPASSRDVTAEILHDLRSPLSAVRVYAGLIAERARRGEPAADEHVRNLASEIELLELLVEAPFGDGTRRTDLVRLLRDLVASYQTSHAEKLHVDFVHDVARAPVAADPVSLQRIFRNVLDNAVQYTPPGGEVTVRVGLVGRSAIARVRDTGVGMTPEEKERAFELSYRGPGGRAARSSGRGLGLTVARDLVLASGGDIAVESEAGRGSEVRIVMPLATEEVP